MSAVVQATANSNESPSMEWREHRSISSRFHGSVRSRRVPISQTNIFLTLSGAFFSSSRPR
ncbi:hypothetical protein PENTCL1PPCAC_20779 [Pristionchus entomophagus]|uniref:Uncharacterized protein n=1 Tax=Pristionchus entomophagus TaxID=358040 RepID=A0AAV5TVN7_9BILA|nr:hypothetical protein PENTCL1PPCAC_20779 [Pristionchus entomophagus]